MPWIDPIGEDVSSLGYLNQIRRALFERQYAVSGEGEYSDVVDGSKFADPLYHGTWSSMQYETAVVTAQHYVDHTKKTLAGLQAVPMLAGQAFLDAAGIPLGFRRATSEPAKWMDLSYEAIMAVLAANYALNFVQRILHPQWYPVLDLGGGEIATHKMAWDYMDGKPVVFPTVVQKAAGADLVLLSGDDAFDYAASTGEFIAFEDDASAEWFSMNYKLVWAGSGDPGPDGKPQFIDCDPAYTHGWAEPGDLFGPWIVTDLQRALSTLRWTCRISQAGVNRAQQSMTVHSYSGVDNTCQGERDALQTVWPPGPPWEVISIGGVYAAHASIVLSGGAWSVGAVRRRGQPTIAGIPTGIPSACDIYGLPTSTIWPDNPGAFADVDGLGMADGRLWLCASLPVAAADTRTAGLLGIAGASSGCPVDLLPCPNPEPGWYYEAHMGVEIYTFSWVMKWAFPTPG